MALDVYAGPLTRYYRREWENAGQRQARAQGMKYTQIGPQGDVAKLPKPTVEEVLEGLAAWRGALNRGLSEHLKQPLEWEDAPDTPYLTDRPGYAGYGALVLWAAYADRPQHLVPSKLPEEWFSDPVFIEVCERDSGTRFRQILQPEVWFPCDFDFAFQYATPVSDRAWIGSSVALLRQLQALNAATFRAPEAALGLWSTGEFEAATQTEHAAKVGLAMFTRLAAHSVQFRVPMVLDA